jgi:pilus assembly protein Flp/PilA
MSCGTADGDHDVGAIHSVRKFLIDRRAVTALEYGIIAGVLGLVLITIFRVFGTKLSALFTTIGSSV